jgi:hypothetical protein
MSTAKAECAPHQHNQHMRCSVTLCDDTTIVWQCKTWPRAVDSVILTLTLNLLGPLNCDAHSCTPTSLGHPFMLVMPNTPHTGPGHTIRTYWLLEPPWQPAQPHNTVPTHSWGNRTQSSLVLCSIQAMQCLLITTVTDDTQLAPLNIPHPTKWRISSAVV